MNKVVATYWDNSLTVSEPAQTRTRKAKHAASKTPQLFLFVLIFLISLVLCLAVNFRAISEMDEEVRQNVQLIMSVEKLKSENLVLQEEIFNLRNDSETIEREARKIGMIRPNEKILVPTD